jgi:hypothetical protein
VHEDEQGGVGDFQKKPGPATCTGEGQTMEDEIQQALAQLESLGLVAKSGEFRQGRPVYVTTVFSQKLRDAHPSEEEFWKAVEQLSSQSSN